MSSDGIARPNFPPPPLRTSRAAIWHAQHPVLTAALVGGAAGSAWGIAYWKLSGPAVGIRLAITTAVVWGVIPYLRNRPLRLDRLIALGLALGIVAAVPWAVTEGAFDGATMVIACTMWCVAIGWRLNRR